MAETRGCTLRAGGGVQPLQLHLGGHSQGRLPWTHSCSLFKRNTHTYTHTHTEEKGRKETSMCGCHSCALTGDLAHNPGMCPDWESNWQPFGLQARTQSTEPHQPWFRASFYLQRHFSQSFPESMENRDQCSPGQRWGAGCTVEWESGQFLAYKTQV